MHQKTAKWFHQDSIKDSTLSVTYSNNTKKRTSYEQGWIFVQKHTDRKFHVIYLFHQTHTQVGDEEHMNSYHFLFITNSFPLGKLIHWIITSSFLFFKMSSHLVVVENTILMLTLSNC